VPLPNITHVIGIPFLFYREMCLTHGSGWDKTLPQARAHSSRLKNLNQVANGYCLGRSFVEFVVSGSFTEPDMLNQTFSFQSLEMLSRISITHTDSFSNIRRRQLRTDKNLENLQSSLGTQNIFNVFMARRSFLLRLHGSSSPCCARSVSSVKNVNPKRHQAQLESQVKMKKGYG